MGELNELNLPRYHRENNPDWTILNFKVLTILFPKLKNEIGMLLQYMLNTTSMTGILKIEIKLKICFFYFIY